MKKNTKKASAINRFVSQLRSLPATGFDSPTCIFSALPGLWRRKRSISDRRSLLGPSFRSPGRLEVPGPLPLRAKTSRVAVRGPRPALWAALLKNANAAFLSTLCIPDVRKSCQSKPHRRVVCPFRADTAMNMASERANRCACPVPERNARLVIPVTPSTKIYL